MANVKIAFRQRREPVTVSGELKYRVVTRVTRLYDNDTGAAAIAGFPMNNAPIFLLKKVNLTDSELVSQSEFIRVAVPQDFQETNPTEFEYINPSPGVTQTFFQLAANTDRSVQYDGASPSSDPTTIESPADATVDQNEYYISNLIVQQFDYIEDADTAAENIRLSIQILKERMNDFLNDIFSTMNDSGEYPGGWEEYDI